MVCLVSWGAFAAVAKGVPESIGAAGAFGKLTIMKAGQLTVESICTPQRLGRQIMGTRKTKGSFTGANRKFILRRWADNFWGTSAFTLFPKKILHTAFPWVRQVVIISCLVSDGEDHTGFFLVLKGSVATGMPKTAP